MTRIILNILPDRSATVSLCMLLCVFLIPLWGQSDESKVYKQYSTGRFIEILKPFQTGDYAVGIQAKGKLANVVTNFGQLSSFHVFAPAFEWPAFGEGQDDQQQYGWGVDFMMGIDGDVIESFQDPASNVISRDWQPAEENLFSGEVTVSETDLTPIMASSDNKDTWPVGSDGNPFWPGLFRKDLSGQTFPGEFSSERDLYCVFTDRGNDTQYGIRIEQTAYSFSRRYAEDYLVYRFNIKNTSQDTLRELYPGMMTQFLIDFDNHDLINLVDSNNDGEKDLIYMWDQDGIPQDPWSKVGYIGLLVVNTPQNIGITNFHFFHDDFIPSLDQDFWMLLASDTSGVPDTIRSRYFHGDDLYIDDVSLAPALDPDGQNRGGEITWSFSTGPVDLAPADSVPLEIAVICGDDEQDLLENVDWVWFLANNSWNGSNPPKSPQVTAIPADGKVTVVWDADRAENTRDNINGTRDFEGYKVYRSANEGKTWGDDITDPLGQFAGYKPIAQFDLANGITGFDPISNLYLGEDSGIKHTFVDTTVVNGIEYWYTVTAYDRGDSLNQVESLESSLGLTTDETNLDAAKPATIPNNFSAGGIVEGNILQPVEGITTGEVSIEVLKPEELKERSYKITFNENTLVFEDSVIIDTIKTFNLKDEKTGTFLLKEHPLTNESGDNLPITHGFRLTVRDAEVGRSSAGWTIVAGDTCNFDWYFDEHGLPNYYPAQVEGIADFKLVVTYNDSTLIRVVTVGDSTIDLIPGVRLVDHVYVPIKVYDITDPDNPIDVSGSTILYDFEYWGAFPPGTFGPKGWDLVAGGKGFNRHPVIPYPDELFFINYPSGNSLLTDTSLVNVRTQNFDSLVVTVGSQTDTLIGIPPSNGDEYTILTHKPFKENVVYWFSTTASKYSTIQKADLEDIRVVPNPFLTSSALDNGIMFTNIPNECDIRIYNVAGDLVREIQHRDNQGVAFWDLKNESGLEVAYGLYIYVVKVKDQKQIGKFSIIK